MGLPGGRGQEERQLGSGLQNRNHLHTEMMGTSLMTGKGEGTTDHNTLKALCKNGQLQLPD